MAYFLEIFEQRGQELNWEVRADRPYATEAEAQARANGIERPGRRVQVFFETEQRRGGTAHQASRAQLPE